MNVREAVVSDQAAITRQVKEASDIVAVVGSYIHVLPAGASFKAICPFHNDTRPSLQIDPKWQNYRCWSCGAKGDVFSFVQNYERVSFKEAREILARRAGISLEGTPQENLLRVRLLDAMKWAESVYQHYLLESPDSEAQKARLYLGERKLTGPTVRQFGLGYAPLDGEWLVQRATREGRDLSILKEVGLLGERENQRGFYDRFRDRIMFPIRDSRGQTVGFGGRILPNSPLIDRAPKYYNSTDTPLFQKKELLFGLDLARHEAAKVGYLVVVEGYTDVMMATQCGILNTVATMGTALNEKHVLQLRRFAPRVVLVYDADSGGETGVDRALELFIEHDVELAIATLPDGLDPCDLLVSQGAEPFRKALNSAIDALDYKLNLLLHQAQGSTLGIKAAVDEILALMASAPERSGQAGQVKRELIITRLAQRLGLRQETVWARYGELRHEKKGEAARNIPKPLATGANSTKPPAQKTAPASPLERQLLELLLADPPLVMVAKKELKAEEIQHPGLRLLLENLYSLQEAGAYPDLDGLRLLIDHPALIAKAMELQEVGRAASDRPALLRKVLEEFERRAVLANKQQLQNRLHSAISDEAALDILRKLQGRGTATDPFHGETPS